MKRRVFLGAVGSLGSLSALGYATRPSVERLEVRYWLTETAARYDVAGRVDPYLEAAFDLEGRGVDVSYGGEVSTSTEDGAAVTRGGEWPRRVTAGAVRDDGIDPVSDANLLITDGQTDRTPTGYGIPHVASVGGASRLAELEPVPSPPEVVPYSPASWAVQVAIHEVGHSLGLTHDHGHAVRSGDAVVTTPMLSSYAWDPEFEIDGGRTSCGSSPVPMAKPETIELQLTFSSCAKRELEAYDGGFTPRVRRRTGPDLRG
ncbi:peptidase M10A and M12B matrixin and adamalysin [Natrialbaceae archaeon GCM10025810]|uniref:peptidase M10A and M12B matrixin and adamalysin n=1 Tax=Halovalidus salilacus TaxID=3075124 RepID=UPI00360C7FD1